MPDSPAGRVRGVSYGNREGHVRPLCPKPLHPAPQARHCLSWRTGIVVLPAASSLFLSWLFPYGGGDASQYSLLASNLAAGHGYSLYAKPPYFPTDFRLPAYPFVLSLAYRTGWSHSVPVLHALLAVAAVAFLVGIAQSLGLPRQWTTAVSVIGALSLPWVSMGGGTLSENLAIPATLAVVYVGLFAQTHPWRRLSLLALTCMAATLSRPELTPIVVVIAGVSAARWRYRWQIGLLGVVLALLAPGVWVFRNAAIVHRLELTDPVYSNAAIIAAVDNNLSNPLYLRATPFLSGSERQAYAAATAHYVGTYLPSHLVSVIKTHVKQDVESTLTFPIRAWAYEKTTASIGSNLRNLSFPNILRLGWAAILVIEYALAFVGMLVLWRRRRRWEAGSLALVTLLMFVVGLIMLAHDRLFLSSELILIAPACLALREALTLQAQASNGSA